MSMKETPDVEKTYDSIAESFSAHRRDLWPPMEEFLKEASAPCTVLDIGCGTGRALKASRDMGLTPIGVDISQNQLEEARKLIGIDVTLIKADARSIPLPDSSADRILMIAVLHHLPNREERVKVLIEAKRLLKPGGKALISVWSWDQDRFRERHLTRIRGERDIDEMDGPLPGDFLIQWKDKVKATRFYHLYGPGELEAEARDAGWIVQRSYFDGRNHWIEIIP